MRKLLIPLLLAGSAALAGCMTYDDRARAQAYQQCGTYGMIDSDNDGYVEADEWNAYRAGAYGYWDVDRDGRVDRNEFMNCWYGGGFYADAAYNRDYYSNYWSAFDANNDGYLSNEEYWSSASWARMDRNRNGRIDANEWRWWM